MCEQLAQSRYVKRSSRDSNLRPIGCKSDTLTSTPRRHTHGVVGILQILVMPLMMLMLLLLMVVMMMMKDGMYKRGSAVFL